MASGGPAYWPRPFLRTVWLDGLAFEAFLPPFGWQQDPAAAALRMADGHHVEMRIFRGGSAPSGMRPRSITLAIPPLGLDTEARRLNDVEEGGRSVAFFPQLPLKAVWDAVGGQTQFSPERFLPYGTVAGVTLTSHPISAWLDDVEQTVVTGSPGSGEVQVIATSPLAQHRCIVTPPLSAGQVLRIEYYPLHFVQVQAQASYADFNDYRWSGALKELFLGNYL